MLLGILIGFGAATLVYGKVGEALTWIKNFFKKSQTKDESK